MISALHLVALAAIGLTAHGDRSDLLISEFPDNTYGAWKATGTAFRRGPASGALLPKLEIQNALDDKVISSEIEDDGPTGTLTSPKFKIDRRFMAFRIGGGNYEHSTCLDLLIDGKVVATATGRRSDRLSPSSWDVTRWQGQTAQIRAVDQETGDWGHINVDHIIQTDKPEQTPFVKLPLYHEALRPQFHFTARQWTFNFPEPGMRQEGWINDLNGLIYYDGEYHLFAQRWAKCWLHAVSKDLIHWTELEPAFWEESEGSGVQSGTCVVDYQNTSGLAKDKAHPAMVAFWSRFDNKSQCICYSLDHGRTWTHYPGNPMFEKPERDPKVFWHAPSKHWVMIMYGEGKYHVLTSPDLLHWNDQHHPIADSYECPDFFELPINGDPNNKKWVLIQGNGNYSIGTFNGTEFKEETGRRACDVGPNFYATQSWANTDTGDGRRIQVAWMRAPEFPNMPFNQQISFPCELTLRKTADGLRIFRQPIRELDSLCASPKTWKDHPLKIGESIKLQAEGKCYRIKAEVEISEGAKLAFNLRGEHVTLTSRSLESGHPAATVQTRVHTVEILLDLGSIEAYVNGGEISSTRFVLPKEEGLSVKAEVGTATIRTMTIERVKSMWPKTVRS